MPRLVLGNWKFLDFDLRDSSSIYLSTRVNHMNPVKLNPEQTSQLFTSLWAIDSEADTVWRSLGEITEYSHHLGWGYFISVIMFREERYYDIRRWWMPPGSDKPKPTKNGIRLNRLERDQLRNYQTILMGSMPEIEMAEPCTCWTIEDYTDCNRCYPFHPSNM